MFEEGPLDGWLLEWTGGRRESVEGRDWELLERDEIGVPGWLEFWDFIFWRWRWASFWAT